MRVFPKNGAHFIDIINEYGIDERIFIAFKRLFDLGLTNYIKKLWLHEGTLRISVKEIYNYKDVKKEFDKHFNGMIKDIKDDIWNYEFFDDSYNIL